MSQKKWVGWLEICHCLSKPAHFFDSPFTLILGFCVFEFDPFLRLEILFGSVLNFFPSTGSGESMSGLYRAELNWKNYCLTQSKDWRLINLNVKVNVINSLFSYTYYVPDKILFLVSISNNSDLLLLTNVFHKRWNTVLVWSQTYSP